MKIEKLNSKTKKGIKKWYKYKLGDEQMEMGDVTNEIPRLMDDYAQNLTMKKKKGMLGMTRMIRFPYPGEF